MSPHQNKLSVLRTGHVLDVIRIGAIATTGLWFRLLVTWGLLGIFLQEVAFAENPPPIAMRVFNNEIRKHGDVERARRVAFDYWVVEAAEGRWPPGPANPATPSHTPASDSKAKPSAKGRGKKDVWPTALRRKENARRCVSWVCATGR